MLAILELWLEKVLPKRYSRRHFRTNRLDPIHTQKNQVGTLISYYLRCTVMLLSNLHLCLSSSLFLFTISVRFKCPTYLSQLYLSTQAMCGETQGLEIMKHRIMQFFLRIQS